MGLKFKRFKAKLNWKTKETVPDVVCINYKINSEFENPLSGSIPTSSKIVTQPGTNDVVKQKKSAPKPAVQHLFNTTTSITATTDINANQVNHNKETPVVLTPKQDIEPKRESAPKGILKKSAPEENVVQETNLISFKQENQNQNDTSDADDYKKSALIFMTEDHDVDEETSFESNVANTQTVLQEVSLVTNTTQELNSVSNEMVELRNKNDKKEKEQITKFNLQDQDNEAKTDEELKTDKELKTDEEPKTSIKSYGSDESDSKTVRWRETIIEIKPPKELDIDTEEPETAANEDPIDNFKVHFVKHHNFSTVGLQAKDDYSESESEDEDEVETDTGYYGNRGAYSSQAASIFFAGEEPEPTPRIRNVSQQHDESVTDKVHTTT